MADEVWVQELDTSGVVAGAKVAADVVAQLEQQLDGLNPAAGRARDALGRFVSTASAGSTEATQAVSALRNDIEQLAPAAGRARDAIGRFTSTRVAGLGGDASGIYDLADAYDVLPSKGEAYRQSIVQAREASDVAGRAARQQATEQAGLKSLMEGQSPAVMRASAATQAYAQTLREAGAAAGRGGASAGIFLLSSVIDDAQYGFRAIVNQVPQVGVAVATAFGASTDTAMGFGGALGLTAVAINQNLKHIDEWKKLLADLGAGPALQPIIDGFKAIGETLNDLLYQTTELIGFPIKFSSEIQAATEAAKSQEQGRAKQADKASSEVDAIRTAEEGISGKAMREVLAEQGGGQKVRRQMTERAIEESGLSADQLDASIYLPGGTETTKRKQIEGNVALAISGALRGDRTNIRSVLENFPSNVKTEFEDRVLNESPARKRELKELEERKKAEQKEAEEANKERQKGIDETAKTLAGGALGTLALGGESITPADVQEELALSGQDVSSDYAEEVRQGLRRNLDEMAAERALKEGITPEEATAALHKERNDKIIEDMEKEEKAAADRAKGRGAGTLAEAAAKAGGTAPQIQQFLQGMGLPANIAAMLAGEAAGGAGQDQLQALLKPQQARPVEVFGSTSDYLAKAQASVGGTNDPQERLYRETLQQTQILQQIARNGQGFGFSDGEATF